MPKYVVYDDDGNIKRYGHTTNTDLSVLCGPGEHAMKVEGLSRRMDVKMKVNRSGKRLERKATNDGVRRQPAGD